MIVVHDAAHVMRPAVESTWSAAPAGATRSAVELGEAGSSDWLGATRRSRNLVSGEAHDHDGDVDAGGSTQACDDIGRAEAGDPDYLGEQWRVDLTWPPG
jgi:hypothetical protein